MSQFVDMIGRSSYDQRNIAPGLLDGRFTRDSLRQRLTSLNLLFLAVEKGFRSFCHDGHFVETKVPSIVSTIGACENWQTLFKVDYDSSFFHLLTQTGQLFLEGALTHHERVSCIMKSFRREAVEDERHLIEFTLLEIEGAFGFDELLVQMQSLYNRICQSVLDSVPDESVRGLGLDPDYVKSQAGAKIVRVLYSDCLDKGATTLSWGDDLTASHEEAALRANTGGKTPIFVTHFPRAIKFFNMAEDPEDPRLVLSVDLLLPGAGEAAGGAERENNAPRLKQRLKDSAMFGHHLRAGGTWEDFVPYIDLIERNLTPLHSGCGVGAERVIQSLLQERDIRMCSPDYLTRMLYAWDALGLG
jgi:asparaginyl-tRNA synthetase